MPDIKEALNVEAVRFHDSNSGFQIHFANVTNSVITPSTSMKLENRHLMLNGDQDNNEDSSQKTDTKFRLGGLGWSLPEGHRMEDYLLFWIGLDNSAFTNFILTFNSCEIGKCRGAIFGIAVLFCVACCLSFVICMKLANSIGLTLSIDFPCFVLFSYRFCFLMLFHLAMQ